MWNYPTPKALFCLSLLFLVHTKVTGALRMSTKYPGKIYNSLAENATSITYNEIGHLRMDRRASHMGLRKRVIGWELVCGESLHDPNYDVIKHALCLQFAICLPDGRMSMSNLVNVATVTPEYTNYCLTHCECVAEDEGPGGPPPGPGVLTAQKCGQVSCTTDHGVCMQYGNPTGSDCTTVTVERQGADTTAMTTVIGNVQNPTDDPFQSRHISAPFGMGETIATFAISTLGVIALVCLVV